MVDDLREGDRAQAVNAAFFRARAGQVAVGSLEIRGHPSGTPVDLPPPSVEFSSKGGEFTPGAGVEIGMGDLGAGSVVMIGVDPAPSIGPPSEANFLMRTPRGDFEFIGSEERPPVDFAKWLESVRNDPTLSAAANEMGELAAGFAPVLRECLHTRVQADDLRDRLPRVLNECREMVGGARAEALTRAARLGWPQRIVSDDEGSRWLQTVVLVQLSEDEQPYAVSLASSLASIDATVEALGRSILFGGPLLLALVAGIAWHLVGRSLRVVGDIQREAEQIAFGTLDRRIAEPRTKDEVARLVVTLNRMLDRVSEGARRQREFIGDASHELRTPIASIRAQLEVALSHPGDADWLRVAGGSNEEAIRMQRLVDDLLRIAQLDDSRDAPPRPSQEVDLDDIVRGESAALRGAKVGLTGLSPARVRGAEQDLRRIVRNLLENAERYGRGRIEVSLSRNGSDARLEIEDDGPGIAPEQHALVFERFTRLEESRSRAGGGAGLGLALARGLVEEHGGEIWIEDARIGGARLVVRLPVDPPNTDPELKAADSTRSAAV
jgi:signal transduction histidine kinase